MEIIIPGNRVRCEAQGNPQNGNTGTVIDVSHFTYGRPPVLLPEYRVRWEDGSESWIECFEIEKVSE